jgi:hypothetical protein
MDSRLEPFAAPVSFSDPGVCYEFYLFFCFSQEPGVLAGRSYSSLELVVSILTL